MTRPPAGGDREGPKKKGAGNRRKAAPQEPPPPEDLTPVDPEKRARLVGFVFSALRFLAVVGALVALVFGGKMLYAHATTSSYFAVRYVETTGNERLTNKEILSQAGFGVGDNIFSIDLFETKNRLEAHPWIVEATLEQRLPRTIIVDVVERTAEIIVLFEVPYLVDNTGEIFKRWQDGDPTPDILVTGMTRRELANDSEEVGRVILDAIALKEQYRTIGLGHLASLSEIHRELGGGFSITAGKDPFYIRLGMPPYRAKLNRLGKLLRKMAQAGQRPAVIYFDNEKRPDRVTVKLKKAAPKTD